jgi:predicted TIM-barrel fold metal-dependent hydrolase
VRTEQPEVDFLNEEKLVVIVDVHSHLMDDSSVSDGYRDAVATVGKPGGGPDLGRSWGDYWANATVDEVVTIVFGGKAKLSGTWPSDEAVAEFVAENPATTIGFLSVDANVAGWQDELRYGHRELGLKGVKIAPMYAGFDPSDAALDPLYEYCTENGLPIIAHTGTTYAREAVLDYARPGLFDRVARRFPEQKLVLAHLGHPFEGECIATFRKHPNVYADISALCYRPFQLWRALMLAQEYGVTDKLLFGTDFPFTTVDETVAGVRQLAEVKLEGMHGLDPELLEGIIFRDALTLLGLERPVAA